MFNNQKAKKINNTNDREPTPTYIFKNEEPTTDEYIEIIQRLQRHFPFIRVNGFGRSRLGHDVNYLHCINYSFFYWINRLVETEGEEYIREQHLETRGTATMNLTMVLAILEGFGDLPKFVRRETEEF